MLAEELVGGEGAEAACGLCLGSLAEKEGRDSGSTYSSVYCVCSGNFLLLGERFKHTSGLKVNLVKWRGRAWKPLKWGM